ncbi:MAG: hypothetical protein HY600_00175 [Candidatus Omnitrophica bacterium]|nr:hypothetical protein [Candidatus Omnitrophota bacterium]
MLKRLIGLLLVVGALPALAGYTAAFVEFLAEIPSVTAAQLAFLVGVTVYLGWHTMVAKPVRLYVFGHELMHAIALWLSGGHVKAFKVSAKGGHVTGTKTNFFIALAPYLLPVYTLLVLLAYWVLGWFLDVQGAQLWWYGALGATLAFHLVFTAEFVKTQQPDLLQNGRLVSLAVIYWVNLLCVAWAVAVVSPPLSVGRYITEGAWRSAEWYTTLAHRLFALR